MGISTSSKPDKLATMSPEQQQLLNQMLGGTSDSFDSAIQAIFNQLDPNKTSEFFQQAVADPAIANFKSEILPAIQQSGADLGAKGGSSIDRQMARAGSDLEGQLAQQLAAYQMQSQQQGIQNVQGLLGQGLGAEPFGYQQKGMSPFAQFILGLSGNAAKAVGTVAKGGF